MSDVQDNTLPEADPEVAADEQETTEPAKEEYIEFVGLPPFGTEFTHQHSVDRKHMKDYHDIDLGAKEVVWTKGSNGRFLVPVSEMTPEAAKYFESDPMFKRVTL